MCIHSFLLHDYFCSFHIYLVFDTVIPIVDHSIHLVIGITAAMAWELPFDPFYPEEELPEAYEEGRLPLLQFDFEPEDDDEEDDEDDEKKKQHRRKDNSTGVTYYSKKKASKKPQPTTQQQIPAALSFSQSDQYFNQPSSPYANYLRPMHSANYYAAGPQQPHPYYTNYGSDKLPTFDKYYSNNNRMPAQNMHTYRPNSNKLQYYLSYADKVFREFNAQLNRGGSTSYSANMGASTGDQASKAEKKSDVKYDPMSLNILGTA